MQETLLDVLQSTRADNEVEYQFCSFFEGVIGDYCYRVIRVVKVSSNTPDNFLHITFRVDKRYSDTIANVIDNYHIVDRKQTMAVVYCFPTKSIESIKKRQITIVEREIYLIIDKLYLKKIYAEYKQGQWVGINEHQTT